MAFLSALIDQVRPAHSIDADRVLVVGVSGSRHDGLMGGEVADRVTGVGSVAGAMVLDACRPSRPVPAIEIHGTDDGLVPLRRGPDGTGGATQAVAADTGGDAAVGRLNRCPRAPRRRVARTRHDDDL